VKILYALLALFLFAYGLLFLNVYIGQSSILYAPTAEARPKSTLLSWTLGDRTLGYAREVPQPRTVWLMLHGNAGQAEHRDYIVPLLDATDSLYVLEYPGFGLRSGTPSRESLNAAALEAYQHLRTQNPGTPICVIGESIGSGPACELARAPTPPDKIVLLTPFDTLANAASGHFRMLPIRYMLRDRWDNIAALRDYRGPVEIYGALEDTVVPYERAKALASAHPGATFHSLLGGHNDWLRHNQIRLTR
jgi:pimeloyl-ACP methyl ester carboxylesterase